MTEITPGYIKGLFHHLVRAVGGVEAAGAYLEISAERVSQYQRAQHPDVPSIMHVARLEAAAGQSIVFAALAKAAAGNASTDDLAKETRQATYAAVDLQRMADAGATKKELQAAVLKLWRETDEVHAALNRID